MNLYNLSLFLLATNVASRGILMSPKEVESLFTLPQEGGEIRLGKGRGGMAIGGGRILLGKDASKFVRLHEKAHEELGHTKWPYVGKRRAFEREAAASIEALRVLSVAGEATEEDFKMASAALASYSSHPDEVVGQGGGKVKLFERGELEEFIGVWGDELGGGVFVRLALSRTRRKLAKLAS